VTAHRTGEQRTRQRILEAAAALFSARGYKHVTIRDISREAGANVAAVNYHFGGKMNLYTEVVRAAVALFREVTMEAIAAGQGGAPEHRLREYVRVHCERMFARHRPAWLSQLIHREMNDPTDELATIVDEGLRPRFEYLAAIVRDLLGPDVEDARVTQCTVSIHAQIVHFRPSPIIERLPRKARRAFDVTQVIEHVTQFSLAGIESYRQVRQVRRVRGTN
jgi:AcrR family transcriptional regulator